MNTTSTKASLKRRTADTADNIPARKPKLEDPSPRIPTRLSTGSGRTSTGRNSLNSKTSLPSTSSKSSTPITTKKIPSWDIKGKMNYLMTKLEEAGEEVSHIEQLQGDLQSSVENRESLLKEAMIKVTDLENTIKTTKERQQNEIEVLKNKHISRNRELVLKNAQYRERMGGLDDQLTHMQSEYKDKQELLSSEKMENTTLKLTLEKTNQSYTEVDATLRVLRSRLEEAGSALIEYEDQIKLLTTTLEETEQQAKELSQSLIHEEANKRKLHNTIQELKGNIRVFCRVRPQLTNKNETKVTEMKFYGEDNDKIELSDQVESTLGKVAKRTYQFQFDRVFTPEADQLECFEEISQLIQSALDGYNVCIFAYGQTGSGKTYTMQGPDNPTETTVGMIPRAVQQIYDIAQELKSVGWEYSMEGQFMEIYNETIHDLLGDASAYGKIKHDIHHDKHGNTTITDMNTVVLDSPSKVKNMLRRATMNRATGATNINERSSRSHSVFMLRLSGYNSNTGQRTEGILNLIDLAGSERLSSSGSVGDRLREAQAINKSLSCLGDVIHALVNNKEGGHIPYRNSKLTYLLRNSLGGNCKTLMFVNVSPLLEHFGETLCSLRFATKVNSCQVGTAKKIIRRD